MADKPSFYDGWTEPESAANTDFQPVYPYNNVTQTPGGHSFELDDTPGRERVRLQHGKGNFIEMHPNGDQVMKIYKDGYTIILGDHNIQIGTEGNTDGKLNITVYGDVNMHVTGDKIEQIDGNLEQHVQGNYTQVVDGISSMTSQGDMVIRAGGFVTGSLQLSVGDCLAINGDLDIKGELTASKITSTTRVDVGTGISAGPLGFVSLLGGISLGVPVAVPGSVISTALVVSPIVVGTLMTYGSMLMDPEGGAPLIRTIYDIHNHAAPLGPTSPPLEPLPLP